MRNSPAYGLKNQVHSFIKKNDLQKEKNEWNVTHINLFIAECDNGALLTYFYINGIEVDSKQVGLGMDGSLYVPDTKTNAGKHKVHAVQYKDNDKAKGLVFNRVHEFEIKDK